MRTDPRCSPIAASGRVAFVLAAAAALACGLVLLATPAPATAQSPGATPACSCPDVRDLRNRYCEAKAAIDEYARQIEFIRQAEAKDGRVRPYTVSGYKDHVQPCVQEAINAVTDNGANRTTGETDNACNITLSPGATTCMASLINSHEAVHVTVCKAAQIKREDDGLLAEFLGNFTAFRDGMSLIDMANEERVAYQTEMNRARSELSRLAQQGCPGLTPPAPGRLPTIDPCPPARPRPAKAETLCLHR